MAFNGSGTYQLPAGQPVVTGTTISSSTHNTLASDLATALSSCIVKDGQQTPTANVKWGGFRLTNVGAATDVADAARASQVQNSALTVLASVAGTDTITGSAAITPAAYAAGQRFHFVPAGTNTGATTLDVSGLGAKNVFWNGVACVGGEIRQSIPVTVEYDGTQFHIVGNGFSAPFLDTHPVVVGGTDSTKKVRLEVDGLTTATTRVLTMPDEDVSLAASTDAARGTIELATLAEVQAGTDTGRAVTPSTLQNGKIVLGTEQATTSGTAIDFTGIPSWVKKVTIMFDGVSTSGTSNPLIQIGDSGGVEATGYLGASSAISAGNTTDAANYTTGFGISTGAAANVHHGSVTLTLMDSTNNQWVAFGVLALSNGASTVTVAGSKSLSATLDRVRVTTVGGTDTFDAGSINILYE